MIKNEKGGIEKVRFLSKEGMQKIHEQALLILENTGIEVDHEGALQMLGDAGADINVQAKTAKIPADLVEQSLAKMPRKITLAGRNPERDFVLEPGGTIRRPKNESTPNTYSCWRAATSGVRWRRRNWVSRAWRGRTTKQT